MSPTSSGASSAVGLTLTRRVAARSYFGLLGQNCRPPGKTSRPRSVSSARHLTSAGTPSTIRSRPILGGRRLHFPSRRSSMSSTMARVCGAPRAAAEGRLEPCKISSGPGTLAGYCGTSSRPQISPRGCRATAASGGHCWAPRSRKRRPGFPVA